MEHEYFSRCRENVKKFKPERKASDVCLYPAGGIPGSLLPFLVLFASNTMEKKMKAYNPSKV